MGEPDAARCDRVPDDHFASIQAVSAWEFILPNTHPGCRSPLRPPFRRRPESRAVGHLWRFFLQYINPAVAEKLATRRTARAFFAARAQGADIERALAIPDKAGGEPPRPGDERE